MDDIKERRNPNQHDRRDGSARRAAAERSSAPLDVSSCGEIQQVKGLSNSRVVRWCHCRSCGEVWPWSVQLSKEHMSDTRIGWVGTGVMGISMCGHLMAKGYPTTIYSRTKSRAQSLLDKGAAWADTPGAVAEQSDVIFTIVGLPSDVREVYQGKRRNPRVR